MNRITAEKNCKLSFNLIVQKRRVKENEYILLYAGLQDPPKLFLAWIQILFTSS